MRSRRLLPIAAATLLGALLWFVRPALVRTEERSTLLLLLRGQSGRIRFVNSVTGRPVDIRFRVGGTFHDFAMITDPATEEYYTNGEYSIADVVSRESTRTLRLCSMKGMRLTLGFHELESLGDCLEVTLR